MKAEHERRNRRWELVWKAVANAGKIKVWLTGIACSVLSAGVTLSVCCDSPYMWAHRAFIAAEELHKEDPAGEYSKAFIEMQGHRKERIACKERIDGMEYEAKYIKKLEGILSDYTDEEQEVLEYKVNIRDEQKVHLVCRHPSSGQKVSYRINTTPEGIVTKVEREKKIKSRVVWEEIVPPRSF